MLTMVDLPKELIFQLDAPAVCSVHLFRKDFRYIISACSVMHFILYLTHSNFCLHVFFTLVSSKRLHLDSLFLM